MFMSCRDAGTWRPEVGRGNICSERPQGTVVSVWHISRKACPVEFHHWLPGRLRAYSLETGPAGTPNQSLAGHWTCLDPAPTRHPRGNVHLGLLNCLFPGISQDRSRTWHTQEDGMSHTAFAAQPTEGLGGAHAWDFLSSS